MQSFDTKKTQNNVNKRDKIMHSQREKGIFSQFKRYLQKYTEVNQNRRSLSLSSTYYSRSYKV